MNIWRKKKKEMQFYPLELQKKTRIAFCRHLFCVIPMYHNSCKSFALKMPWFFQVFQYVSNTFWTFSIGFGKHFIFLPFPFTQNTSMYKIHPSMYTYHLPHKQNYNIIIYLLYSVVAWIMNVYQTSRCSSLRICYSEFWTICCRTFVFFLILFFFLVQLLRSIYYCVIRFILNFQFLIVSIHQSDDR